MGLETTLMWGLLFGSAGIGYIVYGRRQERLVPKYCGYGLLFYVYFMPNIYWLVGVGVGLMALPYVLCE